MGTRTFFNKPKTHNDKTMDQLTKQFELVLKISNKQKSTMVESHTELPDMKVPSKTAMGNTDKNPFGEISSHSKYINYEKEIPYTQDRIIQQQMEKSSCQTDISSAMSATRNTPKKCASKPLSRASKGNLMETLAINNILDLWKRSGIQNGRGILTALGLNTDKINAAQFNRVMEKEIASLEDKSQKALMKACLVLQIEELGNLRKSLKQLSNENFKLRIEKTNANRRISVLATEMHEKHTGVVRDLTERLANERENWNNLNSRLESKLKLYEQKEIEMKTELELLRNENELLMEEKLKMQKQIGNLMEKNIYLQREKTQLLPENSTFSKCIKPTCAANDTCSINNDTSGEFHYTETKLHFQMETENIQALILNLDKEIKQTEEQLCTLLPTTSATTSPLESTLAEMRMAYEDCEEYWQNKVAEERNMLEKARQIHEQEKQESSNKVAELKKKVHEYEKQLKKISHLTPGKEKTNLKERYTDIEAETIQINTHDEKQLSEYTRFSPIEVNNLLERQYADLEAKTIKIRKNNRKIFKEKSQEIEALKSEITGLRTHFSEKLKFLTAAYKLNSEKLDVTLK